jgi:hypothetical protein
MIVKHSLTGVFSVLLCSAAFAQGTPVFDEVAGFQVTGLSFDGQAMVSNGGHSFVCALTPGDGRVVLNGCIPVLTPAQQATIEADAALATRAAELEAELASRTATSEAELASAMAQISGFQVALATAQATIEGLQQEAKARDVAVLEEGRGQVERIAELEAELDQARYMVDLRALVIDLEVMSVNVGLAAPKQGVVLAREGLQLVADTFSDACVLTKEIFDANGLEIQKLVQGQWLTSLGVRDEVIKLMISNDEPKLYPEDMARYRAALDMAREAGDGPTFDKGRGALRIAANAFQKLDEATESAMPEVLDPQPDGSLRIKSIPCRRS